MCVVEFKKNNQSFFINLFKIQGFTLKGCLTLFLLTFIMACSKGGDDSTSINAVDFITTIDENPETNASLGTISAAGTGGALSYSITSQIPDGSLSINAITGELKVANASLFDFEKVTSIDAIITILNSEATTTINAKINLNDVDDIASFLSSSKI